MKLRDALRLARTAGLSVERRRGTGELKVTAPGLPPMVVSATVKDAPKALVLFIRKRMELVGTNWRASQ